MDSPPFAGPNNELILYGKRRYWDGQINWLTIFVDWALTLISASLHIETNRGIPGAYTDAEVLD